MKLIFWMVFFLMFAPMVMADVVVVPPELSVIIPKIEERQNQIGKLPQTPVKIVYKDDQIIFLQPSGAKTAVYFNEHSPAIDKHFQLKSANDGYAFEVVLQHEGQAYEHVVQNINGADALFFFNEEDVFVYTQQEGEDGLIELKEWIYAQKPNSPQGSQWVWVFKSEPWQWPLTIEMGQNGAGAINRHMPIAGIPVDVRARSNYMLNMMIKFKSGEPIKKYFPFSEEVVSMPIARFTTKEGISRAVDINVRNSSVVNKDTPKPKAGLDFSRWDEHWRSIYKISVSAKASEYPLLIE